MPLALLVLLPVLAVGAFYLGLSITLRKNQPLPPLPSQWTRKA